MTKLTREQIERIRDSKHPVGRFTSLFAFDHQAANDAMLQLCDMALESLDREGVVMPREPTEEMIVAIADCLLKQFNQVTREEIIAGYKAGLAAALQEGGKDKP